MLARKLSQERNASEICGECANVSGTSTRNVAPTRGRYLLQYSEMKKLMSDKIGQIWPLGGCSGACNQAGDWKTRDDCLERIHFDDETKINIL